MFAKTLRRALLGALVACAFARPAGAAPAFTAEPEVFFTSMSVQSVVPTSTGFRMYLTTGSFRVVSATCADQRTWGLESGIRLSTAAGGFDASSITAVSVMRSTNPADTLRMLYVGIDGSGNYRVLSATSADGLTWSREAGTRLTNNGGLGYIGQLAAFDASTTLKRLYYIADKNGLNQRAGFAVHSASSTDGGLTWTKEGAILPTVNAYGVAATTMTGGKTRIFYTAPGVAGSTAAQVLSATASDGLTFTQESDVRLSTDAAVSGFGNLVVLRSTESFRWRMFPDYLIGGSTLTTVRHALTRTPVVDTFAPTKVQKGQASLSYALTGEVFSPAPTVSFVMGASTFNATSVTRTDDTSLSGAFSTLNRYQGMYGVAVVNADNQSGTKANALEIELPPGSVTLLDNLMRPLKGGVTKVTVELFEGGNVVARLYTVDGGLVATVFDGPMPVGQTQFTWNGRTPSGAVVASGLYLLHVTGPRLNTVEKVVVIK